MQKLKKVLNTVLKSLENNLIASAVVVGVPVAALAIQAVVQGMQ